MQENHSVQVFISASGDTWKTMRQPTLARTLKSTKENKMSIRITPPQGRIHVTTEQHPTCMSSEVRDQSLRCGGVQKSFPEEKPFELTFKIKQEKKLNRILTGRCGIREHISACHGGSSRHVQNNDNPNFAAK